ncbi:trigger factor [Suttonella sp. R2A3]|uniref:trigger factor n=1 Tax=Suttonella sp. R2A3 TaxID=2908648 RepID=UPI001F316E08|nr:trigger factor [Suttonella sp. R2A3]UJF24382.1 trigger factor [Suttonella sp. R2A3]
MQSSVEHTEGLKHKLTVEVPAERVNEAVDKRLKELRPRVRLDGFRPGKVPPQVIKQKYGASVRQEVLSEVIESAYRDAMKDSEHAPVAPPEINVVSGFAANEPVKFEALFEVMPEVSVNGLDALDITLPQSEVQDSDIDEMLLTLRRQQATFNEKTAGAEDSDRVTIDFVGKLDGEAFDGGSGEDVKVTIGSGQMLPDFEEGLKGAKAGEEVSFDVNFPEDYQSEDLAGKTTQFTANVKNVEQMVLPEVDEAFIKNFGIDAKDQETFTKEVRKNMARELENALRRIKRERMFDAILEQNGEQEVAEGQVQQEIEQMARNMNLEQQIPDAEQRNKLAQQVFDAPARRRVRLGLLLGKLFEERKVELDQARVDERLDAIASTYEDPQEVRDYYANNQQAKVSLESAVLEEQLVDELYEQAKVSYEDKTFQEVMAINQQLQH